MIYLYKILKKIRLERKYNANAIARRLELSDQQFHAYETEFRQIYGGLLTEWLHHLDIADADHAWFFQRHQRECNYYHLRQAYPGLPSNLLQRLADVLTFYKTIDIPLVSVQLQKHTLPLILPRPRSADNAIDSIKEDE